jgi:glucose-6-phosphate isomerase
MPLISRTPAWQALEAHWPEMAGQHMRELFAHDPTRAERFTVEACGLYLDYSKNLVSAETLRLLLELAEAAGVADWRARMVAGEHINNTEDRAVLHMALRDPGPRNYPVDGADVLPEVHAVLAQMRRFSDEVREGRWRGHTGQPIRDVVSIGIGGSSLGPLMVCEALRPYQSPGLRVHFVSNVDGAQLTQTLEGLDPATTLFVIASKTFTTQETLANAESARAWCLAALADPAAVARHFVALSTNRAAVTAFGIDPQNMFAFWDWVGGRYSLWSAIGLPIALAVGFERFAELLAGAHAMDRHFIEAPAGQNMPIVLALLGIWYTNFAGAHSQAIIPYAQNLRQLPAYLQQVDMESNGKRVGRDGAAVDHQTGPVVWGQPGTDAQHSFFQLIHQGTRLVPVDFILPLRSFYQLPGHQAKLIANCLAQAQALMRGRSEGEARAELEAAGLGPEQVAALTPHRVFPGNRPSNTLLMAELNPHALGALVALYEHKVFVQGVIWGLDSFDQWGVELGKQLAGGILGVLESGAVAADLDSSTAALIERCRRAAAV